ncbi:hypothetical protein, partial [Methylobacterium sp. WL7]|uniref:hypothetical protein n=1 Tax=Methylobacterium sp. WL7 TaxID=2603900 RepID=UPI001AEE389A
FNGRPPSPARWVAGKKSRADRAGGRSIAGIRPENVDYSATSAFDPGPIVMPSGNATDRRWNMPASEPVFIPLARRWEAKGS